MVSADTTQHTVLIFFSTINSESFTGNIKSSLGTITVEAPNFMVG